MEIKYIIINDKRFTMTVRVGDGVNLQKKSKNVDVFLSGNQKNKSLCYAIEKSPDGHCSSMPDKNLCVIFENFSMT